MKASLATTAALFGLLKLNPNLFWPAIGVATLGNTLGGMLDWWLGYGAHQVADKYHKSRTHLKALDYLERLGPKACLLAWLPIVGDPLCAVAGWLRMPFWPCTFYMAIGKFLRYFGMTTVLVVPSGEGEHGRQAWEMEGHDADFVDHVTDNLTGFLVRSCRT